MDLLWLVIPAAIVLFVVRTWVIARSLKAAAAHPTAANARAYRDARRSLNAHHDRLDEAVAQPRGHLEAAKRLAAVPRPRTSASGSHPISILEDPHADEPA